MTVVESVLAGVERLLLPKLEKIEADIKVLRTELQSLREVMEVKFKAVEERFKLIDEKLDYKFKALEDKLALDKRLTAVEDRQRQTHAEQ
jgi:hypothetical protein